MSHLALGNLAKYVFWSFSSLKMKVYTNCLNVVEKFGVEKFEVEKSGVVAWD